MSLALPLFADLTKAASDVLYGNVQGEGAFTSGAQVKSQTVTAGWQHAPFAEVLSQQHNTLTHTLLHVSLPTRRRPRAQQQHQAGTGPAGGRPNPHDHGHPKQAADAHGHLRLHWRSHRCVCIEQQGRVHACVKQCWYAGGSRVQTAFTIAVSCCWCPPSPCTPPSHRLSHRQQPVQPAGPASHCHRHTRNPWRGVLPVCCIPHHQLHHPLCAPQVCVGPGLASPPLAASSCSAPCNTQPLTVTQQQHVSTALYVTVVLSAPTGSSAHYYRTCMRPAAARSSKHPINSRLSAPRRLSTCACCVPPSPAPSFPPTGRLPVPRTPLGPSRQPPTPCCSCQAQRAWAPVWWVRGWVLTRPRAR